MPTLYEEALIKGYNWGWDDECHQRPQRTFLSDLLQRAYDIGRIYYIMGDDMPSLDYNSTPEEILKRINIPEEDD